MFYGFRVNLAMFCSSRVNLLMLCSLKMNWWGLTPAQEGGVSDDKFLLLYHLRMFLCVLISLGDIVKAPFT